MGSHKHKRIDSTQLLLYGVVMRKTHSGFSIVEAFLVTLAVTAIAAIGWTTFHGKSKPTKAATITSAHTKTTQSTTPQSTPNKPAASPDTFARNESSTPGTFSSSQLGISFSYPTAWKLVNASSSTGIMFRLQSPDFRDTSQADMPPSFSGTQITVVPGVSGDTYAEDRTREADPSTPNSQHDVTDFTVGDRKAFSFTYIGNETGLKSEITELDAPGNKIVEFLFQPSDVSHQNTDQTVFNALLSSVEFL